MVHINSALGLFLSAATFVAAAPAAVSTDLVNRATCTFTDAAAAIKGKAACSTIILSNIVVPAGTTLDLTGLTAGTKVEFAGKTTFGYEEWSGPLISIAGTNIVVTGASGHSIDMGGARWWDTQGSNGGKTKPKAIYLHKLLGASTVTGLNVLNTPIQAFSINGCVGLTVTSVRLDNSAGDAGALGHNTDAFDVGSSTSVSIVGAIVKNQDDCLAVNSGTKISFTGANCVGGHGISIGSVGGRTDNVVNEVTVANCVIKDSDNGVRIKTVSGATGSVKAVTYRNIVLSNIRKYGIVIQQDYLNGSPTGTPTAGVPITGLSITGVTGSVASTGTNVYILCAACSNWTWSGNTLSGGKKSTKCVGIPTGGAAC